MATKLKSNISSPKPGVVDIEFGTDVLSSAQAGISNFGGLALQAPPVAPLSGVEPPISAIPPTSPEAPTATPVAPSTGTGLFRVPTEGVGPGGEPIFDVFGPEGHISGEDPSVFQPGGVLHGVDIPSLPIGEAPGGFKSKFAKAFDQAKTTLGDGAVSDTDAGTAVSKVPSDVPDKPTQFLRQDDFFNELVKTWQDFMSSDNQRASLVDTYKTMLKESGVEEIDLELIDLKSIIEGSEDDIRREITASGGFATNSQILALTNARNKSLIRNYNTLLETRNSKEKYLSTIIGLEQIDRQSADAKFESMFNMGVQIFEMGQQMKRNATEAYDRIIDSVGYDGLLEMTQNDPYTISVVERGLGLPSGGLKLVAEREFVKENLLSLADAARLGVPYGTTVAEAAEMGITPDTEEDILSPTEAARLGVPYGTTKSEAAKMGITPTLGVPPKPEVDIFAEARNTIQLYKDNGYSREDIEKQYEDAGTEIPLTVQSALDTLYPEVPEPEKVTKWWNPFSWF